MPSIAGPALRLLVALGLGSAGPAAAASSLLRRSATPPAEEAHQASMWEALAARETVQQEEIDGQRKVAAEARSQLTAAFDLLGPGEEEDGNPVSFGEKPPFARPGGRRAGAGAGAATARPHLPGAPGNMKAACSAEEVARAEKVVTKDLGNFLGAIGVQWPEMTEGGKFPECSRYALTQGGVKGGQLAECFTRRAELSLGCSSCWEQFWVSALGRSGLRKGHTEGCQSSCAGMLKHCDDAFDDMVKSQLCLGQAAIPCLSCVAAPAAKLTGCVGKWNSVVTPISALNATVEGIITATEGITQYDNGLERRKSRGQAFHNLRAILGVLRSVTSNDTEV